MNIPDSLKRYTTVVADTGDFEASKLEQYAKARVTQKVAS
jgi:hypothetical protein